MILQKFGPDFEAGMRDLMVRYLDPELPTTDTGHWQAKRDVPMVKTKELLNVVMEVPIAATPGALGSYVQPNQPWADEHFAERVSGIPYNPPPSHVNWPFAQKNNEGHVDNSQQFSHTYPERLWPKQAGLGRGAHVVETGENPGIRFAYGDLNDLVTLLVKEPYTRQAFIPLWFPEDINAAANLDQRVPCTLGYHFILRQDRLHCFYPMRSIDMLRHARDDIYLAGRLVQWVIGQCRDRTRSGSADGGFWSYVQPGVLTLHAVSCHVFLGDLPMLRKKYG